MPAIVQKFQHFCRVLSGGTSRPHKGSPAISSPPTPSTSISFNRDIENDSVDTLIVTSAEIRAQRLDLCAPSKASAMPFVRLPSPPGVRPRPLLPQSGSPLTYYAAVFSIVFEADASRRPGNLARVARRSQGVREGHPKTIRILS